jgi:hypothetical protein
LAIYYQKPKTFSPEPGIDGKENKNNLNKVWWKQNNVISLCQQTLKLLVMIQEETKLNVKTSHHERELTFNEWVEKYKVSSQYQEPTPYFQGNPSSGFVPMDVSTSPLERFLNLFSVKM